jgi:hypothetical protein
VRIAPSVFGESDSYGNFDLLMVFKHLINAAEIKNGLQLVKVSCDKIVVVAAVLLLMAIFPF